MSDRDIANLIFAGLGLVAAMYFGWLLLTLLRWSRDIRHACAVPGCRKRGQVQTGRFGILCARHFRMRVG